MASLPRILVSYRIQKTDQPTPNGGKNTRILVNVRGLTESAIMSELRRHVKVKENQEIILMSFKEA